MKRVLGAAFCLLIVLQTPALADREIAPESVALVCFDPVSGQQFTLVQSTNTAATCPKGYQAYPLLKFERVAGAPPLTNQERQPAKEGHDVQPTE